MKYENAKDVLPKELFDEVQKYASGKLLYFPIAGQRSMWGTKNGNRYKTEQRNREIKRLYESGYSHDELCFEEGRLMKVAVTGTDEEKADAVKMLSAMNGRMAKLREKYFGF